MIGIEQLLHISEISDSFIRDIEKYGSVGDQIKVKILSIDKDNGFLRVSYKQVPPEEMFTSHVNQRRMPTTSEDEFLPLKDKLDTLFDDEKYDLLASNGMLVKRPVLITSSKALFGFKQEEYENIIKKDK